MGHLVEKMDSIISAVASVHAALKDLDGADRARVLASVRVLLGVPDEQSVTQQSAPPDLDTDVTDSPPRSGRRLSVIELIQEKSPSTNAQKIALFAYYRDKVEGKPRFARDDLKRYFATAHESPPSNYDRDFVSAVVNGWIHEEGSDSYITSKGIEVVEAGFVGERKSTRKKTSARKKSSRKKTSGSARGGGRKKSAARKR